MWLRRQRRPRPWRTSPTRLSLRRRPIGIPAPYFVKLPPGESALGQFSHWDSHGNIPAGCILADFVGTVCDYRSRSGYRVAVGVGSTFGHVGSEIPLKAIASYFVRVAIIEKIGGTSRQLAVLAPMEG